MLILFIELNYMFFYYIILNQQQNTTKAFRFQLLWLFSVVWPLLRITFRIDLHANIDNSNVANSINGTLTANEFKLNSLVCQCTLYKSNTPFQNCMCSWLGLYLTMIPSLVTSKYLYCDSFCVGVAPNTTGSPSGNGFLNRCKENMNIQVCIVCVCVCVGKYCCRWIGSNNNGSHI